jgi:hypothetical protein
MSIEMLDDQTEGQHYRDIITQQTKELAALRNDNTMLRNFLRVIQHQVEFALNDYSKDEQ